MSELRLIETQEDLNNLLASTDWEGAFVREAYVLSPSYLTKIDENTVAPDAEPDLWLLVILPENKNAKGIEFNFRRMSMLNLDYRSPLSLWGKVSSYNHSVEFGFQKQIVCISAEECFFKFLSIEESTGASHRYGSYKFSI